MRRWNGLMTAVLILLSAAGIVGAVFFLRHEDQLEAQRQQQVSELDVQLRPLNEKRKELQQEDKKWQEKLEEEKSGKPCLMLVFNTMDRALYEMIYDRMEQYGFRGMFALKDGRMPGSGEDVISSEEFSEMMDSGWEYVLSVDDGQKEKETEEVLPWLKDETEEETEEETGEEEQTETEEQSDNRSFVEKVKDCLGVFDEYQLGRPDALLCTQEQYAGTSQEKLANKGFQRVYIMNTEEYPVVGEPGDTLWTIDTGVFTQKDNKLEAAIEAAIREEQSMVITVNDVKKISDDSSYDLSATRFEAFLIYLKNLEADGTLQVLTLSEFSQYREWHEKNYSDLVAQYADFHEEMNRQIEELDAQEQQIVDTYRSEREKE